MTTDPEYDLPDPEHGNRAAQQLARRQRTMARRQPARGPPASKGYLSAKRAAAKLSKKVARQRQDTARKWDQNRGQPWGVGGGGLQAQVFGEFSDGAQVGHGAIGTRKQR